MKILFVCSGNEEFSTSNLAFIQASALIVQNINVEYYFIKGKGIIGYLKNILPLHKQIKGNSYSLIHAHYGISGWVAFFAKNARTKLVVSFMGNDLLGDHAKKNGESTIFGNILVALNKQFAKYVDYIILKSNEMSDKIHIENKSVIPNGVDLSTFRSFDRMMSFKKVGWDPQSKHVLFLADPSRPEKNFDLAKKAFKISEKDSIHLHFLKQILYEDLVYYYSASDVGLLTSFHEGSPNVIKEAMACNCPIVCTDVGDVREVMGDTEGCYIASFDPIDVAEKIKLALSYAEIKGRTNGRNRIIELGLDSETISDKLIEVYKKVLKISK